MPLSGCSATRCRSANIWRPTGPRYPSAPPPPPRDYRQIFRRNRPYLIPGTTVLRNNFGVDTQTVLSALEFVATAGRMVGWHRMPAVGCSWDRAGVDDAEYFTNIGPARAGEETRAR